MARRRPRKREQQIRTQAAPRIRRELTPAPRAVILEPKPDPLVETDPVAVPRASGTAVGIMLGLGVLIGAIIAFVAGLSILPGVGIGGVVGAIAGIIIDRRRATGTGVAAR